MGSPKKIFLSTINRIGQSLPKRIQRLIADSPGILIFFEKLSSGEFTEVTTPEGYRLILNPLLHSNLVHSGNLLGYEPVIRKAIEKFTRPGMTAYDVGANVGVFSLLFASIVGKEGQVYAFEPEKNNTACLEKSILINNIGNLVLDKRAVGISPGKERFDRRGGAFSGRLVGEDAAYATTENIEEIETVSIDHLISSEGYRVPDIIKIDVEGNEAMVMKGMEKTLTDHEPVIICELHTHLGESSDEVINLLNKHGYSILNTSDFLADGNLEAKTEDVPKEKHIVALKMSHS